jgi:hypothetical protein
MEGQMFGYADWKCGNWTHQFSLPCLFQLSTVFFQSSSKRFSIIFQSSDELALSHA